MRVSAETSTARTLQAVREVRAHMTATFPLVDHVAVHRILAAHDIRKYPDALMLVQPAGIEVTRSAFWRRQPAQPSPPPRKPRALPFFSGPYYRLANDDLRGLDIPMVLHWQIHGRLEGRSPHPFIDVGWLSDQLPGALPGEVVDVYLTDRTQWLLSPSPYVETEAFMLSGRWDGATHPLLQIIRDFPVDPWLRGRVAVIDLAEADDELQLAATVLTSRNPGLARLSPFSVFGPADGQVPDAGPGRFRVVPGFALGSDQRLLATAGNQVLSGDGTAVRLSDRVVVLDTRDVVVCDRLVFVTSPLEKLAVEQLATGPVDGLLVAPYDAAQQEAFDRAGVAVLPHSRQVTVEATSVELVGEAS